MGIEGRILDPEHPAVKFYYQRYHVEFIGKMHQYGSGSIDECGSIKALFEDDYQKLFKPNAYFINITDRPEQLKNFKIEEVRVSEVERRRGKMRKEVSSSVYCDQWDRVGKVLC